MGMDADGRTEIGKDINAYEKVRSDGVGATVRGAQGVKIDARELTRGFMLAHGLPSTNERGMEKVGVGRYVSSE